LTPHKANFFERRVGDYQKAGVMASARAVCAKAVARAAGGDDADQAGVNLIGCGFKDFVFTTEEDF
jgi:hypothetical protein